MKTLLAIPLLLGAVSLSQGQLVDFENFNNSLIYTNSVHNGPATGLMSGTAGQMYPFQAGSYVFELFAAETSTTTIDATLGGGRALDNGGWGSEAYGVNTATPGLMNGNITTDPGTLIGWGGGETANFVVVGWSANLGDSWASYAGHPDSVKAWWNNGNPTNGVAGWFGISDIAQDVVVGGGGIPVPTIFGPTAGYEVQGFTLNLYTPALLSVPNSAGTALRFNGTNSQMQIGKSELSPPWTAEFWVNRQDAPSYSAALLSDTNYALKLEQFNYTRKVGFTRFNVADYVFNYSAPTNKWVHLAFVCDSNTRLYVNGVLTDQNTATISLPMDQLGWDAHSGDYCTGLLDEVRVWNVARSQAVLQANMCRTLSLPQSGLVAYWRFDEGAGTTANDSTGNGNTGTLVNLPLWGWDYSTAPFSPYLFVTNSATTMTVAWCSAPAGYVLQESSDVLNWTNSALSVPDNQVTKTVSVPIGQVGKFYRLKKQ